MNWASLTYQQKFKMVLAGFAVMFILSYLLAIKRTISLYFESRELQKIQIDWQQHPHQLKELKARKAQIQNQIQPAAQLTIAEEQLLEILLASAQEHGVTIRHFGRPISFEQQRMQINTYTCAISGKYHDLLRVIQQFESTFKAGKIASVQFKLEKDRKTRRQYLQASIQLQTVNFSSQNKEAS